MLLFGLVPISKRPPRAIARAGHASISGCGCGKTNIAAAVFAALGMKSALAIHSSLSATPASAEWRPHIGEENAIFFPALRLAALMAGGEPELAEIEPKIQSLMDDHVVYLDAIDHGENLPHDGEHSVEAHAALEDALAEIYAEELFSIAQRRALSMDSIAMPMAPMAISSAKISGDISSSVDFEALAKQLDDNAKKDAAARATRTKQANDQLDDWGKALNTILPGAGSWLAENSKLALAVEGAVVRWAQGDWNSDEQKARALNSVKNALDHGIIPESFNADEDFAKTYADKIDDEVSRAENLDAPWKSIFEDYIKALKSTAGDPRVASLIPESAGNYGLEFGPSALCMGIMYYTGVENPSSGPKNPAITTPRYGLADLMAAVASVHMNIPFPKALSIAYAALGKMIPSHPTICSGRGTKGDSNTYDYSMGPYLYTLQAWIDLSAEGKREHPFLNVVRAPSGPIGAPSVSVVGATSTSGSFVKGALVTTAFVGVLSAIALIGFGLKTVL